jgi:RND family efflux transporter MFP subunit
MHLKSVALISLSMVLAACGSSNTNAPGTGMGAAMGAGAQASQSVLTVAITRAVAGDTAQMLDTAGSLFAWQEVAISAEVSGYRIADVLVDVGDAVSKGQVLARLDDTLLRESFSQAQAAVAVAKANMEQAQASARRGNALQQPGVISKQDAEQLNTAAATATAQLTNAESLLQSAKQRLEYANIRASDSGVISVRTATPGQIANAGVALFSLIRDNRIEWRAEVPAYDIGKVRRGMTARIKRPDGTYATGTVRTLSPGLDPNTQRGTAYVDLKLDNQVRPGMYMTGSIELAKASSLRVPLAAVTVRDGFSYVFVLQPDNLVRQQRVTVGRLQSDSVELIDGITVEDRIVASGVGLLRDGDRVSLADSAANAPANDATRNTVQSASTKTTP